MDAPNPVTVWTRVYKILGLQRAVIVDWHYADNMPLPAIASKLGLTVQSVQDELKEALERLRTDPVLLAEFQKEIE